MHLINKIFLGLTIVIAPVYFFFAGKVLTAQRDYRESCLRDRAAVQEELQKQRDLRCGADGIYRSRVAMEKLVAGRGRIWLEVHRTKPDEANGSVSLTVAPMLIPENANPTDATNDAAGVGVEAGAAGAQGAVAANVTLPTQIELFEQVASSAGSTDTADTQIGPAVTDDSHQQAQVGKYLGQFSVKVVGNQWSLTPTRELAPSTLGSLTGSKAKWLAYERMPQIRPDVLIKQSDGGVGAKLRRTSTDTDAASIQIVDYSLRLHAINDTLVNLAYQQNRLAFNINQTDNSTKLAGASTTLFAAGNQVLAKNLASETQTYQAVKQWTRKLRTSIEDTNAQIASLYAQNVREVTDLASIQRETLRQLRAISSSYASR